MANYGPYHPVEIYPDGSSQGYVVGPDGAPIFGGVKSAQGSPNDLNYDPGGFIPNGRALSPEMRSQIIGRLMSESFQNPEDAGMMAEARAQEFAALQQMLGLSERQVALSEQQAAYGQKAGDRIIGLSNQFLRESTPLRLALTGAVENRLGVAGEPRYMNKTGNVVFGRAGKKPKKGLTPVPAAPGALFGPRAPERLTLEQQFQRANQDILATTPRGGLQTQMLGLLPQARAREVSNLEANATDKALGLGLDLGYGTRGLALQGIGAGGSLGAGAIGGAAGNVGNAAGNVGSAAGAFGTIANSIQSAQLAREQLGLGYANLGLGYNQLQAQQDANQGQKKGAAGAGAGSLAGAGIIAIAIA